VTIRAIAVDEQGLARSLRAWAQDLVGANITA
jgi:hypothetical protein